LLNCEKQNHGKIGTIGAVLAATLCPACFPMLSVASTALGFGIFRPFEGWVLTVLRVLVVVPMLGNILSFFRHRLAFPLIIGLAGFLLTFFALCVGFNQLLLYLEPFGHVAAWVLDYVANQQCVRC
jgi:hypothetical protein